MFDKIPKQYRIYVIYAIAGIIAYLLAKYAKKKIVQARIKKAFDNTTANNIDAKAYAIAFYNAMHARFWDPTDEDELLKLISEIPTLNAFNQVAEEYKVMYPKVSYFWQTGSRTGSLLGDISDELKDTPEVLNTFMNILKSKK